MKRLTLTGCLAAFIFSGGPALAANEQAMKHLETGYQECKAAHQQRRVDIAEAQVHYQNFVDARKQAVAADPSVLDSTDPAARRILSYCGKVGQDLKRTEALVLFQQGFEACTEAEGLVRKGKIKQAEQAYKTFQRFNKQAIAKNEAALNVYSVTEGIRRCKRVWVKIVQERNPGSEIVEQLDATNKHLQDSMALCERVVNSFSVDQEQSLATMKDKVAKVENLQSKLPHGDIWTSSEAAGIDTADTIKDQVNALDNCLNTAKLNITYKEKYQKQQAAAATAAPQVTPGTPVTLTISIKQVRNNEGTMFGAIFNNATDFNNVDINNAAAYFAVNAEQGAMEAEVVLPAGQDYAMFLYHDEDENADLNLSQGIPTEGYAYSNNVGLQAVPSFEDATFEVADDTKLTVHMIYF